MRSSRSTRSTGGRLASTASASRPATLERSCGASAGSREVNKDARDLGGGARRRLARREHAESGPATIVHGDYRLGNTMFAADAPAHFVAVFDWEMATIGDPLADVGFALHRPLWSRE